MNEFHEMHTMQFTPQRLDKVNKVMRREEIDALLVTRRPDVQYLTGYQSPNDNFPTGCVIIEGQQPQLVISNIQHAAMKSESVMAKVQSFIDVESEEWYLAHSPAFWDRIVEVVEDYGIRSGMIGLQQDWLSVKEFEHLKSSLPDAGFKDFSKNLWRLRQIKDAAEINAIRQAVKISEIGIRTALEIVVPGKSEEDASIEIEAAMRSAGAQLRGIRAAVLSGTHAIFPFFPPSSKRIQDNDIVVIDVIVSHSGYYAELTRMLHMGTPTDSQRRLFNYVLDVFHTIETNLSPQITINEIAATVTKKISMHTSSTEIVQPLGCSIGLSLREPPQISPNDTAAVREGMVFTIHPSAQASDIGCIKIADVFLVTADGCESFTTLTRETM